MIGRALFSLASPAGRRARLSILIFHRVTPQIDPLFPGEPDAQQFDQMMGWLKRRFNVLPLRQAVQQLVAGTLPARAAAVSFDDGYADNYTVATPILQRHGITATFFIASGFLDGGRMWNDSVIEAVRASPAELLDLDALGLGCHPLNGIEARRAAVRQLIDAIKYREPLQRRETVHALVERAGATLPDDLMLSSAQLRALRRAGQDVGAHTISHPILARLDEAEALREMADGRAQLESILAEPVPLFAYPNGKPGEDYRPEHARMVESLGFEAAVATHWAAANQATDRFQLPRFTPWDRTSLRFTLRLAHNLGRDPRPRH